MNAPNQRQPRIVRAASRFLCLHIRRIGRRALVIVFPPVHRPIGERHDTPRTALFALREHDRTAMRLKRRALETRFRHSYKDAHRDL